MLTALYRLGQVVKDLIMACSHRRHGRDKTVLSMSRWRCEHNTADKTRQFCLVRLGGVNKPQENSDVAVTEAMIDITYNNNATKQK